MVSSQQRLSFSSSKLVFFFCILSLFSRPSLSASFLVDGVSVWKTPVVHVGDSVSKCFYKISPFISLFLATFSLKLTLFFLLFCLQFSDISTETIYTSSGQKMHSMSATLLKPPFLQNLTPPPSR